MRRVASFTPQLVMRQGRESEATEAFFCLEAKKASSYQDAYRVPLFSLSACMCNICRFSDCESCTRPSSTNSGSMEAGECGVMSGTCFIARPLKVVVMAALQWISWCVVGGAGFSMFSVSCIFKSVEPEQSASTREGATTAGQSAYRELAPRDPHQVYHVLCSHLRIMASVDL